MLCAYMSCTGSCSTVPPFARSCGSSVRGSRHDARKPPTVAGMSGLRWGGAGSKYCSRASEVVGRTSWRRRGGSRSMAVSTIDPALTAINIEYLREHASDQSIPVGVGAVHVWLAAHQGRDPLRMRHCRDSFSRTQVLEKFPKKLWNFMFWMHILHVLHVFQSILDLGFTADAAKAELSASLSHGIVLDAWPPLPPHSEWGK